MNSFNFKSSLSKGLMIVGGLIVFALALIGSFYLAVAAIVIMMFTSLISMVGLKPQTVKVKTSNRQPLDGEYQVLNRKPK